MDWGPWLPLGVLATSVGAGLASFAFAESQRTARVVANVVGAVAKVALVVVMIAGFLAGHRYEARWSYLPGVDLVLRVDDISLLFVALSSGLWLVTTVYAIGYLEGAPRRRRFFGFFSLCVTATMGIALAGNLVTFLVFYEMLTVTTYPLVVHRATPECLTAGRTYLAYTLAGGVVLLAGVVWLHHLAGPVEFRAGGVVGHLADTEPGALTAVFALLVGGLAVKAAMVPVHGWLPVAMVAPAPVSALLHAVAVVKAGAYGILRVVYEIYGIDTAAALGVLSPLAVAAAVTILYGSIRALAQDELKRRLAYSTVSQLSYIVLGAAVAGTVSTTGALVHLVHQGIMKITLFFCAGNVAETLGVHHVSEMRGVGRRMPVTMAAFTVAALGMIGLPPTAGFVTKWYLGLGALEVGQDWVLAVLLASSLLNAAYFLPIVVVAWFQAPDPAGDAHWDPGREEARQTLLVPAVTTAVLSVAAGLLAAAPFSPLDLARDIAQGLHPGP
jgi:multicomponent Na+:H+ antiporter subunit D